VRANEVGSLKHEVGSVVDIDRCTSINSMPLRPLRPSVRANEVGSLKHEVGSEVGSVVDIDWRTLINSMPLRPLRPLRPLCELTK
jgi:hypothetical protein